MEIQFLKKVNFSPDHPICYNRDHSLTLNIAKHLKATGAVQTKKGALQLAELYTLVSLGGLTLETMHQKMDLSRLSKNVLANFLNEDSRVALILKSDLHTDLEPDKLCGKQESDLPLDPCEMRLLSTEFQEDSQEESKEVHMRDKRLR